MKVEKIELENYKKVRSLVLLVDGENLRITGTTGQAKTTIISALWELIEMVGEPVTTGEEKGKIRITLADGQRKVFAERRFTAKTKTLAVVDSEGNKVTAAEFKSWFSSLADNPQNLLALKPTEQVQALLQCVQFPAGFDLGSIERELAATEMERTDLSRDIDRKEKEVGAEPRKVDPVDPVDAVKQLQDEIALAEKIRQAQANMLKADNRLAEIDATMAQLTAERQRLLDWKPGAEAWLATNSADVQAAQDKVNNLTAHNQEAARWQSWKEGCTKLEELKAQKEAAQAKVLALREQKKIGLESASWPLQGLSISDGEIYYKGVPFAQAGDSEKMLVCGVLAAEQIQKKPIKVVRMDKIESMSPTDFEFLQKIFNEKGIQVLSTRVTWGGAEPGELLVHDGGVIQ